ncbi:hypothetical protein SAMN05660772_02064 [Pasteurella testudinis DSM 23072]|uniref:Uncharacterized protein n=1 Tax=Pasteurella testudinis DSM 23072 TaxID=1122938 RepID=A0A1W1UMN9_9PAST|nr:hypothetical protein SAMN05660772_02064 [Pasteurella testudinis DSM 23072]SUB52250.1 Uncharacterised protein [Pasteurella testudinis]
MSRYEQQGKNGQTLVLCLEKKEMQSGGFSTLNFSACHNDAKECSLSQVLEKNVAGKYLLSEKACKGILNRAEKRNRILPPLLKAALLNSNTQT